MSKTHKQWMRECIEECKTCGNLNTASGAERLVQKFAEHMDESLPTGDGPYMQLVTDADGNAKWEDKAFGEKTTKFFLVEESAVAYILQSGDLWIGSVSNLTPPITYNASVRYVITINGVDYDAIVFDSQHLDVIVALPDVPTASGGKGHRVRIAGNNGSIVVYDCMENTELELVVSVSSLMHEIKTIDPKYLPTTVPVIQSASIGQTIVVKAVDENGKPTEWEAADMASGGGGAIKRIESTDTENMVVLRTLESGSYVLYGRFKPYEGADSTMTFSSGLLVNVIKRTDDTQIQIFYPVNNCVQHLTITDTEYTRKDVYLNDLAAAATAEKEMAR